ncbi:hypothetical protein AGMMS49991_00760 [Spirochaetia bacterium]|nr:hypothetical protein AGMMS49991_00760 [Spirochaetia bacterium]
MRKLVFILIGFIAVVTFIRALDSPVSSNISSPDLAVEISGGAIDSPLGN